MSRPNSSFSRRRRNRPAAELDTTLSRRLQSYVTAAKGTIDGWNKTAVTASALSIAGVAFVASLPADAEIVYTPANIHIQNTRTGVHSVSLDINNDGQPDFRFQALWGVSFSSGNDVIYQGMRVFGNLPSNQAMSARLNNGKAALPIGARVGPDGKFGAGSLMATCDDFNGSAFSSGQWISVQNRYLGVKFQIDGETHYGWVRMNVTCNNGTITGYAYETIANQRLRTGVRQSDGDATLVDPRQLSPKPGTLGVLAAGVVGLSAWRPQ